MSLLTASDAIVRGVFGGQGSEERAGRTRVPQSESQRRAGPAKAKLRALVVSAAALATSACGVLPVEFNLSPIYRQRIDPDGNVVEVDAFWPLFNWQRREDGGSDVRLRPLWRRIADAEGTRSEHEFLVPLGEARFDAEEDSIRFLPLFHYRQRLEHGKKGQWDRDWHVLALLWGGSSWDGENYFAFFPFGGTVIDFLTYDRITFALFPLFLQTERHGKVTGTHFLWPFVGWGGGDEEGEPSWWRVLPFYGQSIHPGKYESYTALFPFFHWGRERLDKPHPYDSFMFWPLFGWKSGGAFFSWTVLWPFFRHGHKVDNEASKGESGEFTYWDFPWPIFRYKHDTWSDDFKKQFWIMPFYGSSQTPKQDSEVVLYPFYWNRHYWNKVSDHRVQRLLPFWLNARTRYKKVDEQGTLDPLLPDSAYEKEEDRHVHLWPLVNHKSRRDGRYKTSALDPWPYDGYFAKGIREAWDWSWTLFEIRGDEAGNWRTRSFLDLWTSRNFAGRRYQCSVPWLFNYVEEGDGRSTLRLFQFLPIRWGGSE